MNDTPPGWRVQLGMAAILAPMVALAVRVDYNNNTAFGATISPEAATVLGMAAILVAALPAVASIIGWCWLLRAGTALFLALTVFCADKAYSGKQEEAVRSAQTRQELYTKAKEKETRAKEVLSSIKEVGDAEELGALAKEADAKLAEADAISKKDCKKPHSGACKLADDAKKQAEADKKLAHERLSQAKARNQAKADLADGEAKSASGPAERREKSRVLTWLFIAATQLVALLGEKAACLLHNGWQGRQRAARKPKKAAAPVNPTGGTREPLPANVISLDAHKHSVKAWLDSAAASGGELKGGEALKAYKRWAGRMAADMTAGELRSILAEICGAGAIAARTSGYVVRGIQLRTGAAQAKAAIC